MDNSLRSRIYELYANYARCADEGVLAGFAADVDFRSYAPVSVFPFLGHHRGKAAVGKMIAEIRARFDVLAYQPIFVVVEQDNAAVIVLARYRQRSSGRTIHLLVADFLRFHNGLIIEMRQFIDSFDAVEQVLGRAIDVRKT